MAAMEDEHGFYILCIISECNIWTSILALFNILWKVITAKFNYDTPQARTHLGDAGPSEHGDISHGDAKDESRQNKHKVTVSSWVTQADSTLDWLLPYLKT